MTSKTKGKRFTGWHMFGVLCAFFGVVTIVNLINAYYASSTFGGLVVDNSYVASQEFNGWLEKAREEKALGWDFDVTRGPHDQIDAALSSAGHAMTDATITAVARHPLGRKPERDLTFRATGAPGHYQSVQALPEGRWIVHIEAKAHGKAIHRIFDLQ